MPSTLTTAQTPSPTNKQHRWGGGGSAPVPLGSRGAVTTSQGRFCLFACLLVCAYTSVAHACSNICMRSWKRARVYGAAAVSQRPLLLALILQVSTPLLFFCFFFIPPTSDKCCLAIHLCFPARLAVSNLYLPAKPPVAVLLREASAI